MELKVGSSFRIELEFELKLEKKCSCVLKLVVVFKYGKVLSCSRSGSRGKKLKYRELKRDKKFIG